jgi:hypothetical protein
MINSKEIGERLYETSLLEIEWGVFSRSAHLWFGDDGDRHLLRLDRIHCVVIRQSLLGTSPSLFGPDCHVHYLDVSQDTSFLERYLSDESVWPTHVVMYDVAGRTPSDIAFQKPYHLSIVCQAGHLDFIADIVELDGTEAPGGVVDRCTRSKGEGDGS